MELAATKKGQAIDVLYGIRLRNCIEIASGGPWVPRKYLDLFSELMGMNVENRRPAWNSKQISLQYV